MKVKWIVIALLLITVTLLGNDPLYFVVTGEARQPALVNRYKTALLEQLRLNDITVIDDESIAVIRELMLLYETGQMERSREVYEKYQLKAATNILNASFDYDPAGNLSITLRLVQLQGVTEFNTNSLLRKDEANTSVIGAEHAQKLLYRVWNIGFRDEHIGSPYFELAKSKNTYTEGEQLSISITCAEAVYLHIFYRTGETLEYFLKEPISKPNSTHYLEGTVELPPGEQTTYLETLLFVATIDSVDLSGINSRTRLYETLQKTDGSRWEIHEISYEIRRK